MIKRSITWKLLRFINKVLFAALKFLAVFVGREILMRKQAEARTEAMARTEAQSRMNEFLGVVSHELKTPLTSIKGNIQLMRRRLRNVVNSEDMESGAATGMLLEARELLERTEQQINRLAMLINTLLESSRINANTIDLLTELCELNTLVHEVVQDKRYTHTTRTIHLELPEGKTILVMADAMRIKQVIVHYLSNAHKYSKFEKSIDIYLQEEGKMARIVVRDKGPGIPVHEQKHIWERFYRMPNTKVFNGSEIGLGLGLHISRTIVEQHHGQVGVQSAPGEGSTFWFTLPLYSTQMKEAAG